MEEEKGRMKRLGIEKLDVQALKVKRIAKVRVVPGREIQNPVIEHEHGKFPH